jgi:NADH dehydrogenase (ubiquinone) Fe-S protein 5
MAIFHPYLRNPLSDITGSLNNHQMSKCGEFEMRMMECLEAYGVKRGLTHPRCEALAGDFKECVNKTLSVRVMLLFLIAVVQ